MEIYKEKLPQLMKRLGIDVNGEVAEFIDPLDQRIQTLQQQAANGSPETAAELEAYRQSDRHYLTRTSHLYHQQYGAPYHNKLSAWLDRAIRGLPEDQAQTFTAQLKDYANKNGIEHIDGNWMKQTLHSIAPNGRLDQDTLDVLWNEIPQIMDLKQKGQDFLKETAKNAEKYQNFEQANRQRFANDFQSLVADEVRLAAAEDREIQEILPVKLDGISDPQNRAKAEARNARFAELEKEFSAVIRDFNLGPRSAARRGLQYIKMQESFLAMQKIAQAKEAELKAANEEITQLRKEVGFKRKVADAAFSRNGRIPAGSAPKETKPPAPKLGQTNARNSLDDAFRNWQT